VEGAEEAVVEADVAEEIDAEARARAQRAARR
jgi:hypothetical protein